MLNRRLIETQLQRLRASLQRLRQLAALEEDEFMADRDHFAIAEHHFRRAVETVFDIGRHLIARCGWEPAETYGEIAQRLGERRVLTTDLTTWALDLARYRNRLVHVYWQVTARELYGRLADDLPCFETFARQIEGFLQARDVDLDAD